MLHHHFLNFLIFACIISTYGKPQYPEAAAPGYMPASDAVVAKANSKLDQPMESTSVKPTTPPVPKKEVEKKPIPVIEKPKLLAEKTAAKPKPVVSKKPSSSECNSDTLFVVDSTSSVRDIFQQHKDYVSNVIEQLDISPETGHVAVILYSSRYRQKIKYSLADLQDKDNITKVVKALPFFSGVTATGQALKLALEELKHRRADVVTNLVVITDGFSFDFIDEPIKEIHSLPNVRTFAVTIGEACRKFELLMMSGTEENLFIGPDSYKELIKRLQSCNAKSGNEKITASVTNTKTDNQEQKSKKLTNVMPTTTDKKKPESTKEMEKNVKKVSSGIEKKSISSVKVSKIEKTGNLETKVESTKEGQNGHCQFDAVFVIDASGSLRQRYQRQLQLAMELPDVLGADSNFALVTYSGKTRTKVAVHLGSNITLSDFKTKLNSDEFMGGTTDTERALQKAHDEITGPGVRGGKVLPIVLVFTDGFSRTDPTEIAKQIHRKSVLVFAIGVANGQYVNEKELQAIASNPSNVYLDSNFQKLKDTLTQLSKSC